MTADIVNWLVPLSTVALAIVFAAAGIAKLLDLNGSRAASRAFGVPAVARMLWSGVPVNDPGSVFSIR